MSSILKEKLYTNRRVWLWTAAVVFVVIGFIDPDGAGIGKVNAPPLLVGLARLPFVTWRDFFSGQPFLTALFAFLATLPLLLVAAVYLCVIVAGYVAIALIIGWLLHFPLVFITPGVRQAVGRICNRNAPSKSASKA